MRPDGTDAGAIPVSLTGFLGTVDVAPDGEVLVFSMSADGGPSDIYTVRADGSELVNLTHFPSASDGAARWSPNGQQVVFASQRRAGNLDILIMG